MLVVVKSCIRCHRCHIGNKQLSASEIAAILVCHKLNIFDASVDDVICDVCRSGITNQVADEMLRIRKEVMK